MPKRQKVTHPDGALGVVELQALLEKAGVQCNPTRTKGLLTFLGGNGSGVVQQSDLKGALEDLRKFLDRAVAEQMEKDMTDLLGKVGTTKEPWTRPGNGGDWEGGWDWELDGGWGG